MLEKYQYLGSGERGFISRLTRGTLERRMTLDWMIEQFSSIKCKEDEARHSDNFTDVGLSD